MKGFGFVYATKMLVDEKRKVRYMYREEPDDVHDSGWRFFCGDETDEYVNDPDNTKIYDINTILAIDPSIKPYLECKAGMSFMRENENDAFTIMDEIYGSEEPEEEDK